MVTVVSTILASSPAQPHGLICHFHEEAAVQEASLLHPSLALTPSTCRGTPVRGVGRGNRLQLWSWGALCPQFLAEKVRKEMQGRG